MTYRQNVLLHLIRSKSKSAAGAVLTTFLSVWLFMALAPCAMSATVAATEMQSAMDNCIHCTQQQAADAEESICQNTHQLLKQSVHNFDAPLIADTLVLFETLASLTIFYNVSRPLNYLKSTISFASLHPLSITGILLI